MEFGASVKQREYIASMWNRKKDNHAMLSHIWDSLPLTDENHPDERVDNRILILADRLRTLTSGQASYIIKAWRGERGYSNLKVRDIIHSLHLI